MRAGPVVVVIPRPGTPRKRQFFTLGADLLLIRSSAGLSRRPHSEWMSIAGSSSIRRLKDCPVVMGLHEFAPVGGRATSGRDGRRLERFAEVCENLPDRAWFADRKSAATGGCQECEGQGWFRTLKAV